MKSLAVIFALVMATSTLARAEEPKNIGPEIINLKMGVMQLPFKHRKHQQAQKSECFHCHKPDKWKMDEWSKEVAHELCISCHDLNDNGPVECKGCHTK
jgi:predicted CXXCH cytochrome family protein